MLISLLNTQSNVHSSCPIHVSFRHWNATLPSLGSATYLNPSSSYLSIRKWNVLTSCIVNSTRFHRLCIKGSLRSSIVGTHRVRSARHLSTVHTTIHWSLHLSEMLRVA